MNMLAFTFFVYLTSILATALAPALAQADVSGKARVSQTSVNAANLQKPTDTSKKSDSTKKTNEPARSAKKLKTATILGLNHLSVRVEILEKSTGVKIADSAYILLPAATLRKKMPVVVRIRLIASDSSGNTTQEYQLILDSAQFAVAPTRSPAHIPLPAASRDSASVLGKNAAGTTPVLPLATTPSSNANFWQQLALLGSGLAGLFSLLWATSRFLVFSVTVKPDNPERKEIDTTLAPNNAATSELVPIENNLGEKDKEPPPAATTIKPNAKAVLTKATAPALAKLESGPAILVGAAGSLAERYFFTELLLTAGPRKKYMSDPDADKDLGEDACGLVANSQQLLLWVLDGTSDQYCLRNPLDKREYFSSRLLAQGLSNKLRSAFTQLATTSLDKLLMQAVQAVKADWLRQIQALPMEEQAIIKVNIEQKNIPECATTLLIGTLAIGGELVAYRSGDCKMVLYTQYPDGHYQLLKTALAEKNEASNDRLFFRLVINAQGELDIQHNTPKYEIIEQAKVQAIIAFSDGIGLETEARLKEPEKKSLMALREEIIYQLQGTADDKAICFVEIRDEAKV